MTVVWEVVCVLCNVLRIILMVTSPLLSHRGPVRRVGLVSAMISSVPSQLRLDELGHSIRDSRGRSIGWVTLGGIEWDVCNLYSVLNVFPGVGLMDAIAIDTSRIEDFKPTPGTWV